MIMKEKQFFQQLCISYIQKHAQVWYITIPIHKSLRMRTLEINFENLYVFIYIIFNDKTYIAGGETEREI